MQQCLEVESKPLFDENHCETYPVPPPPLAPKFPEDGAESAEKVDVQMEVRDLEVKPAKVANGGGRGSAVPPPKAPPPVKVDGSEVDVAKQTAARELAAKLAKEPKPRGRKPKAKVVRSPNTKVASPADDKALRRNTPLKRKTPDKAKQDAVKRNLDKDMEAAARAAQRKEVAVQALEFLKGLEIDDLQIPGDGFDKLPLVYTANFARTS